jgi:hypothetical protein
MPRDKGDRMSVYTIHQRAEIWFEVKVEADSPEEARQKAWHNDVLDGWEQLPDSLIFQDEFDIMNVEEVE